VIWTRVGQLAHAAIEGDQGGIARLRLDRRGIAVVCRRAGTPAEDEATVTVDEHEDAAGSSFMPTRSSGVPRSYHVNPSASASGAPSRPGENRTNPLSSFIDKEVTVASRVV
jgi:hypothetical protein